MVDTASNNNWEIGQPNKAIFQSALSIPNAIVTKLDTSYSINDTSSFTIRHIADFGLNDLGMMWISASYKINSDTLTDYGTIEFSPDNGISWINFLTDTVYAQQGIYYWINEKPVFSGNNSDWQMFTINIQDYNHLFNITYDDTVLFRFSFISDSIQTFKDGWMLDDIDIEDWHEGIYEDNYKLGNIITYPNPCSSESIIEFDNLLDHATLTVFNAFGQQVKQLNDIKGQRIIFNSSNLPDGLYFIQLIENNTLIATDKIQIQR